MKELQSKLSEGHSSHHNSKGGADKSRNKYYNFMLSLGVIAIVVTFVVPFDHYDPDNMWHNIHLLVLEFANFALPMFFFIMGVEMVSRHATKNIVTNNKFYRIKIYETVIPFFVWLIIGLFVYVGVGGYYKHFFYNLLDFKSFVPLYYLFAALQLYILRSYVVMLAQTKKGLAVSIFISLVSLACVELLRDLGVEIPFLFYGGLCTTWLMFPVVGVYVRIHGVRLKFKLLSTFMVVFWLLASIYTIYAVTMEVPAKFAILPTKITSYLFSLSMILLIYVKRDLLRFHKYFARMGRSWLGIFFCSMIIWFIVKTIFGIVAVPFHLYWVKILTIIGIIGISYAIGMALNSRFLPSRFGRKYFGF